MEYFENRTEPEIALWRSVIVQGVLDCLTQSKRKENINARNEALLWFDVDNDNFRCVCAFAMLEPSFVVKRVEAALNDHSWRRGCDVGKGMQFVGLFQSKKVTN
jgi:hypothetical protein